MNLIDKIAYCSGKDFWHLKENKAAHLSAVLVCDGPNGIRKQTDKSDNLGMNASFEATCFPSESILSCSFDKDLAFEYGYLLGMEAKSKGVSAVLGPGLNIKRNPLCGRNFEYLSEDPYLSGILAAAYISGVQSTGVGACAKHFACNSQEYYRMVSNSLIDERSLREIYLSAFEIALKQAKPEMLMAAYNLVNGEYCCSNTKLLRDILRDEWKYQGLVVSDWAAVSNRKDSFQAGCNLIMPGGNAWQENKVYNLVKEKKLNEKYVDESYNYVLEFEKRHQNEEIVDLDIIEQHNKACKIAEESAVLLENKESILPLNTLDDVCFIGYMARDIRYQGSGSSKINPTILEQVTDLYPNVPYAQGYDANGKTNNLLINEAINLSEKYSKIIYFIGLPSNYESEGFDRDNLKLPVGQIILLDELSKINKNIIAVLYSGSVVEIDFVDKIKALLYMGLPGQAGAKATMNLILGKAVPSGKLSETWPIKYEDCVSSGFYGRNHQMRDSHYREGIYVGYRYYDKANINVRYPFGYGLSYTHFSYHNLNISKDGKEVSVEIKNDGLLEAKEAVLLYVCPPKDHLYRPVKELKAFKKISLKPNESTLVTFNLDDRAYAIFNNGFKTYKGEYLIQIGNIEKKINIDGDSYDIPDISDWYLNPTGKPTLDDFKSLTKLSLNDSTDKPFTLDSPLSDILPSCFLLRIIFKIYDVIVAKKNGRNSETYKGTIIMALECPIRGIINNTLADERLGEAICAWANKQRIEAIKSLLTS